MCLYTTIILSLDLGDKTGVRRQIYILAFNWCTYVTDSNKTISDIRYIIGRLPSETCKLDQCISDGLEY